jgi:hypothetical protein
MYNEINMPTSRAPQQTVPRKRGFRLLRDERIESEKRLRLLTRLVIWLCVLLLVFIIARAFIPVPASGGLDGCLRSTGDAAILTGTVKVGDQSAATGSDGCFYFAALPAGNPTLRVELPQGVWQQPVTISPGQATSLGNLNIDLSKLQK